MSPDPADVEVILHMLAHCHRLRALLVSEA